MITGVACDSRKISTGGVFVALPGTQSDGHAFIRAAVERGAAAIVIQAGKESLLPECAPAVVAVSDPYFALAWIAANFHDHPSLKLHLAGVTGTNGKSTTVHLIDLLRRAAGHPTGIIGTIAYHLGTEIRPAPHTTPQAPELQELLAEMRDRDISHVTMEVSSHALHQYRADGCRFRLAVFTNLTRDHLDYHVTEEDYFAAKLRLFTDPALAYPGQERINIVNIDDPAGQRITAAAQGKVFTYGIENEAAIRAIDIEYTPAETCFTLQSPLGERRVKSGLLGRFNVYNALAAIGAAIAEDTPLDAIAAVLAEAQPPAGRFQRFSSDSCTVVVDYAHTPDGLQQVLTTARSFCRGRLLAVFGCGGDRDPGKRPIMGELVSRLADVCVITSDNPRTENPDTIITHILAGIPETLKAKCLVEPDREKAIHLAIAQAQKDDLVIIAGKGHETYQLIAGQTFHFDDREVAEEALKCKDEG